MNSISIQFVNSMNRKFYLCRIKVNQSTNK
nr:MAG TPA: hypothetical protein [Caudoviricetes sp.]